MTKKYEIYNLTMYDKDDDIMDIDGQKDEPKTPYDYADGFSSPYDSIVDLENEIKEDSENNTESASIPQFNIKQKNVPNIYFMSAAILVFLLIVGAVFLMNSGIVQLPQGVSAILHKQDKNIENTEEITQQKRNISVTTADDEEISRILEENNMGKSEGELPDLPPMANGGQVPVEDDIIVGRVPSGRVGRMDPFNPVGSSSYYDVMVPPSSVTPDTDAQSLLTAKITGILYTSDSPSAIVNIAGSDQLVRPGDTIDGFHIVRITKDKVTIKTGKNVYAASVGELVNVSSVGVRDVPNLRRKFAGPYSGGGRIIEINSMN